MEKTPFEADLIMLSNFDRWGGGMETWAYGFIPTFLDSHPNMHLTIYGLTASDMADNTNELVSAMSGHARHRLTPVFLKVKWPRIPLFFSMIYQLRKISKKRKRPKFVFGVGGLFELLNMLYVSKYRKSKKILWLRTIFFNEKANRIPKFTLPLCRYIEIYFLKKVDVLLANGHDIADYYKKYGLKVDVVKNGVDSKRWTGKSSKFSSPLKIAFVGRLAKVKGIIEFLELVKHVKANNSATHFEFIVVGHGPYSDEVKDFEKKGMLSYEGAIENLELPAVLRTYDVCVGLTFSLSSNGGGGTSNALLEQMSACRLILAWDNVIFRQLLNEDNSYLVKQGDVPGLALALDKILKDKNCSILKAEAGQLLMSKFSLEAQLTNFNKVAENAML